MYKNFDEVIEYAINFRHNLHKNPELNGKKQILQKILEKF